MFVISLILFASLAAAAQSPAARQAPVTDPSLFCGIANRKAIMFSRTARQTARLYGRRFATEAKKVEEPVKEAAAKPAAAAAAPAPAAASGGGGGGGTILAAAALAGAGYAYYSADQAKSELSAAIDDLQVQLAGKTNSAFVFIKVRIHLSSNRTKLTCFFLAIAPLHPKKQ